MKLVFLDTETTGLLQHPGAELIEYAFAVWEDGKVIRGIDSQRVLPSNGCTAEAAKINGYTQEAWLAEGAQLFGQADVDNICSYLTDGCLIAGSNPEFDREFYIALSISGLMTVGQDYLAHYFGITNPGEHTAAGDVETSIKVWEALHDHFMCRPRKMQSALKAIAENYQEDPELVKFCLQSLEIDG